MASFNEIEIKQEIRQCLAYGKKGLFHMWIKKKDLMGNENAFGLVEDEDGKLEEISSDNIKFLDRKIKGYCFYDE